MDGLPTGSRDATTLGGIFLPESSPVRILGVVAPSLLTTLNSRTREIHPAGARRLKLARFPGRQPITKQPSGYARLWPNSRGQCPVTGGVPYEANWHTPRREPLRLQFDPLLSDGSPNCSPDTRRSQDHRHSAVMRHEVGA